MTDGRTVRQAGGHEKDAFRDVAEKGSFRNREGMLWIHWLAIWGSCTENTISHVPHQAHSMACYYLSKMTFRMQLVN
jgi:hypothetical protein